MKIRRTKVLEAVIPTASMADIAFLLIVFFMISTVFQVDRTQVRLPSSSSETRKEVVKNSAYIVVTKEGHVKASDGQEDTQLVNMEDIGVLASGWMSKKPDQPVVIKADEGVDYGKIDDVVDHLRNASVTNIKFLTQPKSTQ